MLSKLLTKKRENENINNTGRIENIPVDTARNGCVPNYKVTKACEMRGCDSCNNWYQLSYVKLKNVPKTKTRYCTSCRLDKKMKKRMVSEFSLIKHKTNLSELVNYHSPEKVRKIVTLTRE